MTNPAARNPGKTSDLYWTIGEAANEIGIERRKLRSWETAFQIFEPHSGPRKRYTTHDIAAARALKRLLLVEHYTVEEARALIAEAGADAVIEAYGRAHEHIAPANPAHVLQDAVRSAAAAGFFGEVIAEIGSPVTDDHGENPAIAWYAQARLARLAETKKE